MSNPKDKDGQHSPKSILKKSKQDKRQKSFQWDEMNILQTYHPADKTYGHMKIDEPKTPYVYENEDDKVIQATSNFTPEDLAARLTAASRETAEDQLPRVARDMDYMDPDETEHQKHFREKRAAHYNEFTTVKMARDQIDHENDDNDPRLKKAAEEAARNARINAEMSRRARAQLENAAASPSTTGGLTGTSPKRNASLPK